MVDELFELIVGQCGFIVTLRCDNKFDEKKYTEIKSKLCILVSTWKEEQQVPPKAMLAIVELINAQYKDFLSLIPNRKCYWLI